MPPVLDARGRRPVCNPLTPLREGVITSVSFIISLLLTSGGKIAVSPTSRQIIVKPWFSLQLSINARIFSPSSFQYKYSAAEGYRYNVYTVKSHVVSWASEGFFPWGSTVDFSRGSRKDFSRGVKRNRPRFHLSRESNRGPNDHGPQGVVRPNLPRAQPTGLKKRFSSLFRLGPFLCRLRPQAPSPLALLRDVLSLPFYRGFPPGRHPWT